MDLCLDGVHEEDRPIVRNIIAALEVMKSEKLFTAWTCHVAPGGYLVTVFIEEGAECEFSARELETVHDVNPLRVLSVSVQRAANRLSLRVRVSDRNAPLLLTETQVLRVRKRSRWMLFGQ
jgi:hypothetical protein